MPSPGRQGHTLQPPDHPQEELLAAAAGCKGLFIGFESAKPEGLKELSGKNNLCKCHDLKQAVGRIQQHGILVAGSFIIGFDNDGPGIGRLIADTAERIGVDFVNVLFLTPLPGTRLWGEMEALNRITLSNFPEDWRYFTLTYPVARYTGLTLNGAIREMLSCSKRFYTIPQMLLRLLRNLWRGQSVVIGLAGGLSYWKNIQLDQQKLDDFEMRRGSKHSVARERHEQPVETPTAQRLGCRSTGSTVRVVERLDPAAERLHSNRAYQPAASHSKAIPTSVRHPRPARAGPHHLA